jgi:hypothetical protein
MLSTVRHTIQARAKMADRAIISLGGLKFDTSCRGIGVDDINHPMRQNSRLSMLQYFFHHSIII